MKENGFDVDSSTDVVLNASPGGMMVSGVTASWSNTFCADSFKKLLLPGASHLQENLGKEFPYTFLAPCICQYQSIDLLSGYCMRDCLHSFLL